MAKNLAANRRTATADLNTPHPETEFQGAGDAAARARHVAMARRFADAGTEPLVRFLVAHSDRVGGQGLGPALPLATGTSGAGGVVFEAKPPPPPGMRAGVPSRCYAECRAIAERRTARCAYCEGVAFAGHEVPIEHAWLPSL